MVAGIEANNAASIRLHEKLGFEITGQMKEVGHQVRDAGWTSPSCS